MPYPVKSESCDPFCKLSFGRRLEINRWLLISINLDCPWLIQLRMGFPGLGRSKERRSGDRGGEGDGFQRASDTYTVKIKSECQIIIMKMVFSVLVRKFVTKKRDKKKYGINLNNRMKKTRKLLPRA